MLSGSRNPNEVRISPFFLPLVSLPPLAISLDSAERLSCVFDIPSEFSIAFSLSSSFSRSPVNIPNFESPANNAISPVPVIARPRERAIFLWSVALKSAPLLLLYVALPIL